MGQQITHTKLCSWDHQHGQQNTSMTAYASTHLSNPCWTARQGGKGLSSIVVHERLHDKGKSLMHLTGPTAVVQSC